MDIYKEISINATKKKKSGFIMNITMPVGISSVVYEIYSNLKYINCGTTKYSHYKNNANQILAFDCTDADIYFIKLIFTKNGTNYNFLKFINPYNIFQTENIYIKINKIKVIENKDEYYNDYNFWHGYSEISDTENDYHSIKSSDDSNESVYNTDEYGDTGDYNIEFSDNIENKYITLDDVENNKHLNNILCKCKLCVFFDLT